MTGQRKLWELILLSSVFPAIAMGQNTFGSVTEVIADPSGGATDEYLRKQLLNANTFFCNSAGITPPAFTQNQFGALPAARFNIPDVYGGRNNTFRFFSEGIRLCQGQTENDTSRPQSGGKAISRIRGFQQPSGNNL